MDVLPMLESVYKNMNPTKAMGLVKHIGELNHYDDVFTCFWDLEEIQSSLKMPDVGDGKSSSEAEKKRALGNEMYKEKKFEEALVFYNQSVKLAPHPEIFPKFSGRTNTIPEMSNSRADSSCSIAQSSYSSLTSAYANRSAVLLKLKEYDLCIADVECALEFDLSDVASKTLKERRKKCLQAKHNCYIDSFVVPNERRPPKLTQRHSTIPAFSSALKLAYTAEKGRHVVAARNIEPGELIAVEESYCSRIRLGDFDHCVTCLVFCRNPVPCPNCTKVTFCSDLCRRRGIKNHMKECKIIRLSEAFGLYESPEALLALKIMLRASFDNLKQQIPMLKVETSDMATNKLGLNDDLYSSTDYRVVHHLAILRRKQREGPMLFASCMMAVVMLKVLIMSEAFYVDKLGCPFTPTREDLIMTGGLLVYHLCVYPPVLHLNDLRITKSNTVTRTVGEGIFPTLSLLRHSCNAPTIHYNIKHSKVVKTAVAILEGQEVTLSLVDRYLESPLEERQTQLEKYGLTCSCEACKGDWLYQTNLSEEIPFKCIKCGNEVRFGKESVVCSGCNLCFTNKDSRRKCKSEINRWWSVVNEVREIEKLFNIVFHKFECGSDLTKEDFEVVCNFAALITMYVQQPNSLYPKILNVMQMFFYLSDTFTTYALSSGCGMLSDF